MIDELMLLIAAKDKEIAENNLVITEMDSVIALQEKEIALREKCKLPQKSTF